MMVISSVLSSHTAKKQYWSRDPSYHYHCTLDKGENTVDANLVRVCYKHLTEHGGKLDQMALRISYLNFMTTPGSHNDCYMLTSHRMFFANRQRGLPLDLCPDNDDYRGNVDSIDGLTMAIPVALATSHLTREEAHEQIGSCIGVTRSSELCVRYACLLSDMFASLLSGKSLISVLEMLGGPRFIAQLEKTLLRTNPIVGCYLENSFPSLLIFAFKYGGDFEKAMMANANCGGENVARGMLLGALLGATHGASRIPQRLKDGLKDSASIAGDIQDFVAMMTPLASSSESTQTESSSI